MPAPHPRPPTRGNDRPPADCEHPGRPHHHGTRAAYVKDRCRCRACTAANTADSRKRRRDKAFGRAPASPYVDAAPVRARIAALRDAGHGYLNIARLAGAHRNTVRELARTDIGRNGRSAFRRVRSGLAAAIIAIPLDAPPALVEATGTRRRLHALVALGYPLPTLAAQLRRRTDSLTRALVAQRVTATTAHVVAQLYLELADKPPTPTTSVARARRYAQQRGWAPPMAWDNIDTDDAPNADAIRVDTVDPRSIDEIAVERAATGGLALRALTKAEVVETIRRLAARGHSRRNMADRLHASTHTIRRYAQVGAT